MSEIQKKSLKPSESKAASEENIKKPVKLHSNIAVKYGLGKRKSGDLDDGTQNKTAKTEPNIDVKPVKIALGSKKPEIAAPAVVQKKKKMTVAAAFGDDSDSDPEEMPAEAKMRMRNIGRDTPTAAGPNSFGKTKIGFCDSQRNHERLLQQVAKDVDG